MGMLLALLLVVAEVAGAQQQRARAWRGVDRRTGAATFPELALPELQTKPNTALAFSGGGIRAYSVSAGYWRR